MHKHPHTLLLGNGLNLSYGGTSWSDLMKNINVRDDFNPCEMCSPLPLQAILLTNNNLKETMKSHSRVFYGKVQDPMHMQILQELLTMGFDDILTTNYSYELEEAAFGMAELSEYKLKKINKCTQGKVEPRYLLHSYNEVSCRSVKNRIWHVHGESRKPDSMILGHYWYGNMLFSITEELKQKKNQYYFKQNHGEEIQFDSWLDSFILGDVYVLGFGYDLSELDLWWLLNRKYRENADKGRMIFYEMESLEQREKIELMRLFGVCVRSFGMMKPDRGDPQYSQKYEAFYAAAIEDIHREIEKAGNPE